MKKSFLWILMILLTLTFTGCGGDTKNVSIEYGRSNLYSTQDIDKAVSVVKKDFKSLDGCVLNSLSYAGDEESQRELEHQNKQEVQYSDCIILKSSFHSPKKASGAWEPDTDYFWHWIIVRKDGGSWFLLDKGY